MMVHPQSRPHDRTAAALAKTNDLRLDSYRRFVQMYGDVVLGLKPVNKDDHDPFEVIIEEKKHARGIKSDTGLTAADLKDLVARFKAAIKEKTGHDFPTIPKQLWGAIGAVFGSWMNDRAIAYRRMYDIPEAWGTAVNVQLMVFGNMGNDSGTGVAFTRDAATGEDVFYGEYLMNAQGEDVVAGTRTPRRSPPQEGRCRLIPARDIGRSSGPTTGHEDIEFTVERALHAPDPDREADSFALSNRGEIAEPSPETVSRQTRPLNQLLRPIFPAKKRDAIEAGDFSPAARRRAVRPRGGSFHGSSAFSGLGAERKSSSARDDPGQGDERGGS
jgi:pyruvate,orthophosphate dikinase